jgi:hypothetical protein
MIIKIQKQIHSSLSAFSSNDVWLEIEIDIPYPPFMGLVVLKGDIEVTIKSIMWDSDKKEYLCYDEEDKELYTSHTGNSREISKIVKEYTDMGWNIYK